MKAHTPKKSEAESELALAKAGKVAPKRYIRSVSEALATLGPSVAQERAQAWQSLLQEASTLR